MSTVRSPRVPGPKFGALQASLAAGPRPSASSVQPLHRETTICYAYMCPYAYGCSEKTSRPAQVLMRRCMRYMPQSLQITPALSDLALDLLARHRQQGRALAADTIAFLDRLRPNGPVRKRP